MALSGKPTIKQPILPQAAQYLMRAEDRGREDNADPTDGGQAPDTSDQEVPPELQQAMQQLMDQYGSDVVQAACDQCAQGYPDAAESNPPVDASMGGDEDHIA